MEVQYKRDLNHSYLMFVWKEQHQDYRIQMLQHLKTEELLPCMVRSVNKEMYFSYEISGRRPFRQYYEQNAMSGENLNRLITTISEALEHMKEYLLDINMLVVDPDYIYVDVDTEKFYFCCFPGKESSFFEEFHSLCEYILGILDYREEQAIMLGYSLYRNTMQENFSLAQLLNQMKMQDGSSVSVNYKKTDGKTDPEEQSEQIYITDTRSRAAEGSVPESKDRVSESVRTENRSRTPEPVMAESRRRMPEPVAIESRIRVAEPVAVERGSRVPESVVAKSRNRGVEVNEEKSKKGKKKPVNKENNRQGNHTNTALMAEGQRETGKTKQNKKETTQKETGRFGDLFRKMKKEPEEYWTSALSSYAKEEMFSYAGTQCVLQCTDQRKQMFAPAVFPFVIGSLEYGVDGYVEDESVSRFHARLELTGDQYYVMDLNSEQGTFINEKKLMPEGRYPVQFGDKIRFGRVTFSFLQKK